MSEQATVIDGATVLVGRELAPLADGRLVISGHKIRAIGPRNQIESPEPADQLDASGLVLVPGFIDAHVHIGFASPEEVLHGGVTTVRDLGWPPDDIFPLVERSRARTFAGPRIVAAGPMFTVPGGYPTRAGWAPEGTGLPLRSPDDAAPAVKSAVEAGATIIKFALNPEVGPVMDQPLLKALVDAAHDEGLKATGHVSGLEELDKAIATEVDELAHMLMSDERIPEHTIETMVAGDMAVVPTLSVRFGRDLDTAVENLRRFAEAGGTVVYGTDLGNEGPGPGIDAREIQGMVAAGFGSDRMIASATVVSSEWLGLQNKGILEAGRDADIVALPEEALDDPRLLDDVRMVWRLGRRIR